MEAKTRSENQKDRLLHRFVEASWTGGFDDLEDVLAPDYVGYVSGRPGGIHGHEGLEEYLSTLRAAFTDLELDIGVVASTNDAVWANWKATGTNVGEFMGRAPTGRQTVLTGSARCQIADGRVTESRSTIFRIG